jgi:putative tryptophan/tyrosine transport system substrate-binding protein
MDLRFMQAANMQMLGALASIDTPYSDKWHLVGNHAGRILKGEKPADLPVQQVSKTELVVNLRKVKALGIKVPHFLRLEAVKVSNLLLCGPR